MRNRDDFEALVFERADVLAKKEHRYSSYRNAAIGMAAAVTILTAFGIKTLSPVSMPMSYDMSPTSDMYEQYGRKNSAADETNAGENNYDDEAAYNEAAEENDVMETLPQQEYSKSYNTAAQNTNADSNREELYSDLPMAVVFYSDNDSADNDMRSLIAEDDYSNAECVLEDTQAEEFAEKLSTLEQAAADDFGSSNEQGSFVIIRKDIPNKVVYVKTYYMTKEYVKVVEESKGLDGDGASYSPAKSAERIYYFEVTEEFENLINSTLSAN